MNLNRPRFDESPGVSLNWTGVGNHSHSQMGAGGGGGPSYGGQSYMGGGANTSGVSHNYSSNYGMSFSHNQSQVEPMHHSPISSHSSGMTMTGHGSGGSGGGGGDRVAYLPSYLLGESGGKSPKTKLRKDGGTPNLDLSNMGQGGGIAGMGLSMSNATSPSSHHPHPHSLAHAHSPTSPGGKTSPGLQTPHSLFSSSLHSATAHSSNTQGGHGHSAGQGIVSTPTTTKSKSSGPPKHGLGSGANPPGAAPAKSARLDGSSMVVGSVEGQGNWVTVFGFQPASQPFVLQTFSTVGSIIEYKSVAGCNFMHIRYSNTVEARKALSKNGGIVGGNMMLGVIKYEPTNSPAIICANNEAVQSRIRPLANDNLANQIPVRESGLMSKVTELLGW